MSEYDIAVIGAGPAGIMAAIRAGQLKKQVVLIERNDSIGKKILITGKGRCNLTNTSPIDIFIEKFGKSGQFLRPAFLAFFTEELMEFFTSYGLELKVERQGRVFPSTDSAGSVLDVLKRAVSENKVEVLYNTRIIDIVKEGCFILRSDKGGVIKACRIILATGGASYKETGSSGDGFNIAKSLGHTIAPLEPGLVPMTTKEAWVKEVQGLALKNIRLTFKAGKKKISSGIGEMIFTHFGVSGPLILDLSQKIASLAKEHKQVELFIDLKPGLTAVQIENNMISEIKKQGSKEVRSLLKASLPASLVPVFANVAGVDAVKKASQIKQDERRSMVALFKAMPLTITGTLPLEEAMITAGGVPTVEINPRTLESKVMPGLYFAGEIIEGGAQSGGYNLQQAFSTGYLAAKGACDA